MAGRSIKSRDEITVGTTNVFPNLGYADAGERQTKLRLACQHRQGRASHRIDARKENASGFYVTTGLGG